MGGNFYSSSPFGYYEYPKYCRKKVTHSKVVGLDKETISKVRNPLWFRMYVKLIKFLNGDRNEKA